MIKHELFGQHLRLGNFLFKYAWSIAKEKQFGEVTTYPEYYLWKYLKSPPQISNEQFYWSDSQIKVNWEWSAEEESRVDSLIQSSGTKTITLDSFFQSEKWFENYKSDVYNALQIKTGVREDLYVKYLHLFQRPTIGIGIRLGDFVGHGDFYQIKPSWYLQALEHYFPTWREDYNVVVFSDHIELAKHLYNEPEYKELLFAEPNGTHTHADNFKHYHKDASEQFILGTMCQPIGTKVETLNGKINIEDLRVGDTVISYSRVNSKWIGVIGRNKRGAPTGRRINSISVKPFSGNLINVSTETKKSRYTSDHICIAKIGDAFLNKTLVYLMRKGDKFRVGISKPITCRSKSFDRLREHSDVRIRFATNKADDCWILGVFDNVKEAQWEEILISYKYQIPQVQFTGDTHTISFWDKFGSNLEEGIKCLQEYGRDVKYPFYTSRHEIKLHRKNVIEIRACNLLNNMKMLDYDKYTSLYNGKGEGENAWDTIQVSKEFYQGDVYSMDIDINNTYFADGLLTHNCDHWIIGNSTFSWWQAWLATYSKKHSKVIHSGEVFSETGNMRHTNTAYYYPENWIKYVIS